MASEPLGNVIRRIGLLAGLQNDLSRTDAELLECFASRRDEPAFAALMARHGPMVLGVCCRLLHDAQEAEDAFQAAFLVLARRAASIQRRSLLSAWLYGVAYRIAARLRGKSLRRRTREQTGVDLAALAASEEDASWSDVRPLVHEEVQRLPEKYREAVVLCFLEGKTHDEAAAELHWPLGSVKGRLARAKDLLRSRLARRGLALSVGLLTTALAVEAAPASAALVESTIGAGVRFAAGQSAAGLVPARVIALTQGALQTMWWTKWTVAAVLGLVVVALGVGGVAYHSWGAEPGGRPPADPAKPGARAADKPKEDKDAIQGTWRVAAIEMGGKDAPDNDETKRMKSAKWVVAGEKITITVAGKEDHTVSYKLDSSKKPKEIDITPLDGPENEKGKVAPALYSLEGDVLKICISAPKDGARPTELATKEGGTTMLITLKRELPEKDKPADKTKDDKEAILGAWSVTGMEVGGKEAPDEGEFKKIRAEKWVFTEDKAVVQLEGEKDSPASYKLVPSKKPKEIDFMPLEGPMKDKPVPAIYSLEGDTLKICVPGPEDGPRPTELATRRADKSILLTLKREK